MIKRILVAYDGSPSSRRAYEQALEIAEPLEAEILVVSVAQPPEPATMVETSAVIDEATEHYRAEHESLRAQAGERGVLFRSKVVVGHAADQIIRAAVDDEADLIVMGHRGKSMIERWLMGSVSKRVISYAPCSVLIAG